MWRCDKCSVMNISSDKRCWYCCGEKEKDKRIFFIEVGDLSKEEADMLLPNEQIWFSRIYRKFAKSPVVQGGRMSKILGDKQ